MYNYIKWAIGILAIAPLFLVALSARAANPVLEQCIANTEEIIDHLQDFAGLPKTDSSLFTTEDVNGDSVSDDDKVVCTATPKVAGASAPYRVYANLVNYEADTLQFRVVFGDGDLVIYSIPAGSSYSFTGIANGTFTIDPLDSDGDGIGVAGWVSVEELKSGSLATLECHSVSN